jgi:hypothetical protein
MSSSDIKTTELHISDELSFDPEIMLHIFDKFTQNFNKLHNKNVSLFTNLDEHDVASTNPQLEELYSHIANYNELKNLSCEYIDVYVDINTLKICCPKYDEYTIYCLIEKNLNKLNTVHYISCSWLSLMITGVKKYGNEDSWNVIELH